MSDLLSALQNELSGGDLSQISNALGADSAVTQAAIAAALPALLNGLATNANASPAGASSLANALDRDHQAAFGSHGGNVLFDLAAQMLGGGAPPARAAAPKALDGAGILGHILGGNQASVSNSIASASGMDPKLVGALLPALAPLVMSALGTVKQQQQLDAGGVADYLRQEQAGLAAQAPADDGFGMDDMVRIGTALHKSGILGKLFG